MRKCALANLPVIQKTASLPCPLACRSGLAIGCRCVLLRAFLLPTQKDRPAISLFHTPHHCTDFPQALCPRPAPPCWSQLLRLHIALLARLSPPPSRDSLHLKLHAGFLPV